MTMKLCQNGCQCWTTVIWTTNWQESSQSSTITWISSCHKSSQSLVWCELLLITDQLLFVSKLVTSWKSRASQFKFICRKIICMSSMKMLQLSFSIYFCYLPWYMLANLGIIFFAIKYWAKELIVKDQVF